MDPGPVKIFTIRDVPRLRYICEIIFGDILGLSWQIVTDKRKLGKNPVINYSVDDLKGSFRISPYGLLSETGVSKISPAVSEWKGLPVFFQTNDNSDLPFDIFAASFYLITRYEEYLDFEPDQHGRFKASNSFAFRNNFLLKPVIDLWTRELAKTLLLKFQTLTFRRNAFGAIFTMDLDRPFEYLGKDIFRSIGGFIKELGQSSVKVNERYKTLAKGEKDPWDVFDYVLEITGKDQIDTRFFIPMGDRSEYDKNPSWHNEDYRKLIVKISNGHRIGLHPSVEASQNLKTLGKEKSRLQEIISREITISRFHFIKMSFPLSFRNLLKAGITEDYSLGYPDEPGFRAGIARPFYFYDVLDDKRTDLRIIPFQIMDMTLMEYRKLSPESADEMIASIIYDIKRVGGLFVSLWHNTSLLETDEFSKWRRTFENMLKIQQL
jgi:hypothetical protein